MSLSKEDIFGCSDTTIEKLHIDAWGGDVYVRSLTAAERDKFEASNLIKDKRTNLYDARMDNLRARLVAMSLCDETGKRLCTDADAAALGSRNAAAIALIYDTAARLSGITKEDLAELAGESSAGPEDVSQSA